MSKDLNKNESEWLKSEDGFEYKNVRENGYWKVIRWRGDCAYYSFCPFCGYQHTCWQEQRCEDGSWGGIEYAPEKEFKYCPECGKKMKIKREP